MEVKNKGLVFDSKKSPGSVVISDANRNTIGMIFAVTKPNKLASAGQRIFVAMNHQDSRFQNIKAGTYEEVKNAVIAAA